MVVATENIKLRTSFTQKTVSVSVNLMQNKNES